MKLLFLFPVMIIALNVGAAFVYLLDGDWRHGIYFASAAALTASVTF